MSKEPTTWPSDTLSTGSILWPRYFSEETGGFSEEEDKIICSLYINIGSMYTYISCRNLLDERATMSHNETFTKL